MSQQSTSSLESRFRENRKLQIQGKSVWQMVLDHAYPLPQAPPELCRDAFLAELLMPYEVAAESFLRAASVDSILSAKVKFQSTVEFTNDVEATLLNKMILTDRRKSISKPDSTSTELALSAPDLNKLMRERYGNIASAIAFMAVISQLQQLKHRMLIFRELWSMNVTVDKELRLFSWSIKDYFARFSQPNQVYLDTAERLLGSQIECFKFRMDLKEINRLIDAVIDDLRGKRDVCTSALEVIRDAEMDIEELLTNSQREATERHAEVTEASAKLPRSADPFGTRSKAIHTRINLNDFVYPIEARYRIKWAQTNMEQSIYGVELAEKQLSDQVVDLYKEIEAATRFWEISSMAFNAQVLELKDTILKREMQYDLSMEEAENHIQMTRQRLANAKNDLIFCKEQIPMFHKKIAEVKLLQARPPEMPVTVTHVTKRASRKSSKAKAQKKKAK
ncbi:hypothetical protein KR093_004446 [Drosophila rubida]|uniref:Uncharacterized protein n=1 Tax=Drosophila rubida TaxID=30044 RepID=A0AAD4K472_9MUSC|nr:hypothetical protein KR093_004446 [Drosophila rubida]